METAHSKLREETVDSILQRTLPPRLLAFTNELLYGDSDIRELKFSSDLQDLAQQLDIIAQGYSTCTSTDSENAIRIGIFQNAIQTATDAPIQVQIDRLHTIGTDAIKLAGLCGVRIFCFQELWTMPMGFCTQKKLPWVEFAEDSKFGDTTSMLRQLAKEYQMVIISPILERDQNGFLWNTAVVIDSDGEVLGQARKIHIPLSGKFSECSYYNGSDSGIPLFHTKYGKIGMNICYDRHHPQNWFAHSLAGAQIVFNPCATVQSFSEALWQIEARAAAAANGYYVCAINRVGSEIFHFEGKEEIGGPFFGSSYVACPDGKRTPGLPINKNGILIADLDLKKCKPKPSLCGESFDSLSVDDHKLGS